MTRVYETELFAEQTKHSGRYARGQWAKFPPNSPPYEPNPYFNPSHKEDVTGALASIEASAKIYRGLNASDARITDLCASMKSQVDVIYPIIESSFEFVTNGEAENNTRSVFEAYFETLKEKVSKAEARFPDQIGTAILGLAQFIYDKFINV